MKSDSANNYPTVFTKPFTDDDLSRWNAWCVYIEEKGVQKDGFREVEYSEVVAILTRLEAAEKCLQIADDEGFSDKAIEAHNEWLKSRGKTF